MFVRQQLALVVVVVVFTVETFNAEMNGYGDRKQYEPLQMARLGLLNNWSVFCELDFGCI